MAVSNRFVTEIQATVYDTTTKSRIVVEEDSGGFDIMEIAFKQSTPEVVNIRFPAIEPEMARHLAQALLKVASQIEARKKARK